MAGVHLDAFVAEEVGFAREFQVLGMNFVHGSLSVLVAAIGSVMRSGKAHSSSIMSMSVVLVAMVLAGGAAWFWFDVFVVCGSLAEVFFDAWAASQKIALCPLGA